MKIRTKLTLRYVAITAAVFSALLIFIFVFSEKSREKHAYLTLKQEAVTKAHLFLSGRVDAEVMQSIYKNNREFINEVEVAVYNTGMQLLYHDASDIDIVKETPEMLQEIRDKRSLEFYLEEYQVVGLIYEFGEKEYILTAAAYDGYGYEKQQELAIILFISWIIALIFLAIAGYLLAKGALAPVSRIVDEIEDITESSLDSRLVPKHPNDELGELSTTFNEMLDRLEQSFDSQKMFVSNISHELRTPMAALIAELELSLLRERTPEEYRKTIEMALSDSRKIERLSTGLLDLARSNYDPKQIAMREIRLDELLLDAREMVVKANKQNEVELIFDLNIEEESLITVIGNEYLLKTAFVNLIENNCKFSENKTSFVNISFLGDYSVVRFTDSGIGISEEDAKNLFKPFYRGGNSGYSSGHGIGMTLVQRIVQLHKGTVRVHSQLGEGTVFICKIPHI